MSVGLLTPWQCLNVSRWLQSIETDKLVAAMHDGAEVFDPQTEHVYKYLQVFSAICVSFAHGANDVANAAGPLAGIW